MKTFKSHFWYTKSQRNGILVLVIIIVLLQVFIVSDFFKKDAKPDLTSKEVAAFQNQIDSLKLIAIEARKPKIYPFNPNYITDFKGERLGMSLQEINRLLAFRETGQFINSKAEFQAVTKVSDSLLNQIAPYFKFPDWVVQRNKKQQRLVIAKAQLKAGTKTFNEKNTMLSTKDLNKATTQDFMSFKNINLKLAERIVKYRSKLQGFSLESQLYEVFNISPNQVKSILKELTILEKPMIKKLNVNTVEFKQLLKNPYIDYELCKKIFEYRDEVAELQNIAELKNIKDFPLDKYDRIVLYLLAE